MKLRVLLVLGVLSVHLFSADAFAARKFRCGIALGAFTGLATLFGAGPQGTPLAPQSANAQEFSSSGIASVITASHFSKLKDDVARLIPRTAFEALAFSVNGDLKKGMASEVAYGLTAEPNGAQIAVSALLLEELKGQWARLTRADKAEISAAGTTYFQRNRDRLWESSSVPPSLYRFAYSDAGFQIFQTMGSVALERGDLVQALQCFSLSKLSDTYAALPEERRQQVETGIQAVKTAIVPRTIRGNYVETLRFVLFMDQLERDLSDDLILDVRRISFNNSVTVGDSVFVLFRDGTQRMGFAEINVRSLSVVQRYDFSGDFSRGAEWQVPAGNFELRFCNGSNSVYRYDFASRSLSRVSGRPNTHGFPEDPRIHDSNYQLRDVAAQLSGERIARAIGALFTRKGLYQDPKLFRIEEFVGSDVNKAIALLPLIPMDARLGYLAMLTRLIPEDGTYETPAAQQISDQVLAFLEQNEKTKGTDGIREWVEVALPESGTKSNFVVERIYNLRKDSLTPEQTAEIINSTIVGNVNHRFGAQLQRKLATDYFTAKRDQLTVDQAFLFRAWVPQEYNQFVWTRFEAERATLSPADALKYARDRLYGDPNGTLRMAETYLQLKRAAGQKLTLAELAPFTVIAPRDVLFQEFKDALALELATFTTATILDFVSKVHPNLRTPMMTDFFNLKKSGMSYDEMVSFKEMVDGETINQGIYERFEREKTTLAPKRAFEVINTCVRECNGYWDERIRPEMARSYVTLMRNKFTLADAILFFPIWNPPEYAAFIDTLFNRDLQTTSVPDLVAAIAPLARYGQGQQMMLKVFQARSGTMKAEETQHFVSIVSAVEVNKVVHRDFMSRIETMTHAEALDIITHKVQHYHYGNEFDQRIRAPMAQVFLGARKNSLTPEEIQQYQNWTGPEFIRGILQSRVPR